MTFKVPDDAPPSLVAHLETLARIANDKDPRCHAGIHINERCELIAVWQMDRFGPGMGNQPVIPFIDAALLAFKVCDLHRAWLGETLPISGKPVGWQRIPGRWPWTSDGRSST